LFPHAEPRARFDKADAIRSPNTGNIAMRVEDGEIIFEANAFDSERLLNLLTFPVPIDKMIPA
jgi:hypothetical protein